MTPEDWRFVFAQTGVAGFCFTVFVVGLRKGWWVMGSEAQLLRSIADRFMTLADKAMERRDAPAAPPHSRRGDE